MTSTLRNFTPSIARAPCSNFPFGDVAAKRFPTSARRCVTATRCTPWPSTIARGGG